jgi:predicted transposase YdaD
MQLFQTLHPEMSDVTSAELKTITLKQVITAETNDIIGQYIIFSHVMDEQIQKYGRTRKAVEETIRICRNRSVLVEYLQEREKEVFDIMITLFDQEYAMEQYGRSLKEEGREEGHKEGHKEGRKEGREEEKVFSIRSVMENLKITPEKAMDILNIPASERSHYFALL